MLSAMKEPALTNEPGDVAIFRITWLRTFHKLIAVRIQKLDGNISLTVKILSGTGGYDPGQLIKDMVLNLTTEVWDQVQSKEQTC